MFTDVTKMLWRLRVQKRRVILLAGPIAAGKSSLAALFDTLSVRVIDFDEHAHVFHPETGYNNTAGNIDETIERLVKTIQSSHFAHDVVIDGWFSFFARWWKSPALMELTTGIFQEALGDKYEVQLCILGRAKDKVLDCIEKDDNKFKYPEYDKVIDEKYRVMFDSLMRWQDRNGSNQKPTIPERNQA